MSTACVVVAAAIVVKFDATVLETLEAIVVFATVVAATVVVGAATAKIKERLFNNGEHINLMLISLSMNQWSRHNQVLGGT